MKTKLILFLALLALCGSRVWADVNAPTGYVSSIETGVNYLWCLNDGGNHARFIHADGTKTANYSTQTNAGIFQFEDAGDDYYFIKEVITGKYMYTDYANSITQRTSVTGKPWAYYDTNVLSAGDKADEDKFKWKVEVSTGTNVSNGFFVSSKVNANAVLAATSQGNTGVFFYQFTEAGTINYETTDKYKFSNSQFVRIALSTSELSNSKCYNICNFNAWWAVGSGASVVNSTYPNEKGLNLAVSSSDAKQQFAFIKYIDKYYLYSVSEGKYAYIDGTKLSLTNDFNTVIQSSVTFGNSTNASYKGSYPVVVTVNGKNFGVSYNYNPTIYNYNDLSDTGNASAVCEVGDFDKSGALSKIESSFLFQSSTELNPIYYAWRTAVGNNPAYIYTEGGTPNNPNNHTINTTGIIDAKYAWQFIGDPENGYAIKNKATGTYLGGRNASGGSMGMDASATCYFYPVYNSTTNNKWYCKAYNYYIDRSSNQPYAHTAGNNNDYIRLYNVKFSLSNASSGLQVGSTVISDFDASYLITSSAALSCVTSGYMITAYDGYASLEEALGNDNDGTINLTISNSVDVTYKLMFNGEEIASTVVSEIIGSTASSPSAWEVPDFCSFSCPSTLITNETTEIEVTLSWDGPFVISSDSENATWYYLKLNNLNFVSNGGNAVPVLSTTLTANSDDVKWAFIGNPYDGFEIINKAMEGYYLQNTASSPQMTTTSARWKLVEHNTAFLLHSDKGYIDGYNLSAIGYYSDKDANEEFVATLVSDDYYSFVESEIQPFIDGAEDNAYFKISLAHASAMASAISTARESDGKITLDEYNQLSNILTGLIKIPTSGFYRLKNKKYPTYYQNATGTTLSGGTDESKAETVVRIIVTSGRNCQIMMQDQYVQNPTKSAPVPISSDPVTFTMNVNYPGYASFNVGGELYSNLHMNSSKQVVGWSAESITGAAASFWTIEDATDITLTLNAVGDKTYGTTYLPFDVTLPAQGDVCAYTLTDSGNGWLHLNLLGADGKSIPAGTPVLLRGTSTTSVTATIADVADFDAGENVLSGTYFTMEHGENLVLGKIDGVPGFYKYNFDIKPNKAYIAPSAGAKAYKFMFDDEDATAIDNVNGNADANNAAIYNIAGQRISKLQKGINIVNGKKVLY